MNTLTKHASGVICNRDESGLLFPVNREGEIAIQKWEDEKIEERFFELINNPDQVQDALCDMVTDADHEDYIDLLHVISGENKAAVGHYVVKFVVNALKAKARKEITR